MDVGEDTAGCDGDAAHELVELLVVADGELDVPGDDARLLVVASSIAGELEDLSGEVLEDRREVNWCTSSNAGGDLHLPNVSCDTADRELKSCLCRSRDGLLCARRLLASCLTAPVRERRERRERERGEYSGRLEKMSSSC